MQPDSLVVILDAVRVNMPLWKSMAAQQIHAACVMNTIWSIIMGVLGITCLLVARYFRKQDCYDGKIVSIVGAIFFGMMAIGSGHQAYLQATQPDLMATKWILNHIIIATAQLRSL